MDLSYVASFLDCDGCIYAKIARHGRYILPSLIFSNTDRAVLAKMQAYLACGVLTTHRSNSKPRWQKTVFILSITGEIAVKILFNLLPHLEIKKPQAELVLAAFRTRAHCQAGDQLYYIEEIRRLNRRGCQADDLIEQGG